MENPDTRLLTNGRLSKLSSQEQEVLRLRYGIGGKAHTYRQIGKLVGISPADAQRIEIAAWGRVAQIQEGEGILFADRSLPDTSPLSEADEYEQSVVLARWLANLAVRNTALENYHRGKSANGRRADRSDITVITPKGEIPWSQVSRISDREMRTLMLEVEKKLAIALRAICEDHRHGTLRSTVADLKEEYEAYGISWDKPKAIWKELQATKKAIEQRKSGKKPS